MNKEIEGPLQLDQQEIAMVATTLIERIYLYIKVAPELYSNAKLSKDADFVISSGMEITENLLQKLLKHLPDDFRDKIEKKIAKIHSMDPIEALDEVAKERRDLE